MTLFRQQFDSATVVAESDVPTTARLLCDLRADVAGLTRLFVDVRGRSVAVAYELAEVLDMEASCRLAALDPHATSSVLGLHVYPLPASVYRNIHLLNYGDTVKVFEHEGRGLVVIGEDFPFFETNNTETSIPSGPGRAG